MKTAGNELENCEKALQKVFKIRTGIQAPKAILVGLVVLLWETSLRGVLGGEIVLTSSREGASLKYFSGMSQWLVELHVSGIRESDGGIGHYDEEQSG